MEGPGASADTICLGFPPYHRWRSYSAEEAGALASSGGYYAYAVLVEVTSSHLLLRSHPGSEFHHLHLISSILCTYFPAAVTQHLRS